MAFSIDQRIGTFFLTFLSGIVPSCSEKTHFTFQSICVPFSVAGLTDIVTIEVRFISWTCALARLLVESKSFRTSHAFFVSEVPSGRFGTNYALPCSIVEVIALALTFFSRGVPSLILLAGFTAESVFVPLAITRLANVVRIEIRFIFGTGTL